MPPSRSTLDRATASRISRPIAAASHDDLDEARRLRWKLEKAIFTWSAIQLGQPRPDFGQLDWTTAFSEEDTRQWLEQCSGGSVEEALAQVRRDAEHWTCMVETLLRERTVQPKATKR
ncbi:hypothetical protein Tdes44962_MAKER06095 [Teratosphaeria destructans]|uniref:Uncharacterized protein n=1 Tax=Teratosphaeria destructans TaxID=418781 RepID=A0A9W7SI59_9PEZI|nr:hypothetical protein Tdes44962_MAKER06095 [Teratosphaeria destructans]